MIDLKALATARTRLAEARADLRTAQDTWHSARLTAELALGERVEWDTKRLGSNAEDRKRAFDAAVEADSVCQSVQTALRSFEREVGRLEAELDVLLDARRDVEWTIRQRYAQAFENVGHSALMTEVENAGG